MTAPKYRFCWWCSKQLYGGSHRIAEVNGHDVRLHAQCADEMLKKGEDITLVRCSEGCDCRAPRDTQGDGE